MIYWLFPAMTAGYAAIAIPIGHFVGRWLDHRAEQPQPPQEGPQDDR